MKSTKGQRLAELSERFLSDSELEELLEFYPIVIAFLEKKGDKMAAHYLRMELMQFENFKWFRSRYP